MPAAALLSAETDSDGVALITLRRPEKRNALSIELRSQLADVVARLSRDDGAGCIVLTGAGSAFCSGMDVTEFGGGLVSDVVEDAVARALEIAGEIAAMPSTAVAETKRRILLDRELAWGSLFEDEAQTFRRALLGA